MRTSRFLGAATLSLVALTLLGPARAVGAADRMAAQDHAVAGGVAVLPLPGPALVSSGAGAAGIPAGSAYGKAPAPFLLQHGAGASLALGPEASRAGSINLSRLGFAHFQHLAQSGFLSDPPHAPPPSLR